MVQRDARRREEQGVVHRDLVRLARVRVVLADYLEPSLPDHEGRVSADALARVKDGLVLVCRDGLRGEVDVYSLRGHEASLVVLRSAQVYLAGPRPPASSVR